MCVWRQKLFTRKPVNNFCRQTDISSSAAVESPSTLFFYVFVVDALKRQAGSERINHAHCSFIATVRLHAIHTVIVDPACDSGWTLSNAAIRPSVRPSVPNPKHLVQQRCIFGQ